MEISFSLHTDGFLLFFRFLQMFWDLVVPFLRKTFDYLSTCRKVRNSNSSRYSLSFSSLWFWVTIPTIAVFSKFNTSFLT
jgi:hypothetical protein